MQRPQALRRAPGPEDEQHQVFRNIGPVFVQGVKWREQDDTVVAVPSRISDPTRL
jgi:hypothetical protein